MVLTLSQAAHTNGLPPLYWATGIEGSHIPQQGIDQHRWCQHDRYLDDDLQRIRDELGPIPVRYSLPWSRLCPTPTTIDWAPAEAILERCEQLGLIPQIALMHFGTPSWLADGVAHPDFPRRLADYAAAFADRFRGRVPWYTAMTEPMITALFCGDVGIWYPFRRGFAAYVPILLSVARAVVLACRAIRATDPAARLLHVEGSERHHAGSQDPEVVAMADFRNLRRFITYDLLTGRIRPDHGLWGWLVEHGLTEATARWFVEHPTPIDVMGLNYHPQSEKIVFRRRGQIAQRTRAWAGPVEANAIGRRAHVALIGRDYYQRYGRPLAITETSFCGAIEEHRRPQVRWLQEVADGCLALRAEGIPLIGLTWYGAYDHLDWQDAMSRPRGIIHPVGLWRLVPRADGQLDRRPTDLVAAFQSLARQSNGAAAAAG